MSSGLFRITSLRCVLCFAVLALLFFISRPAAANYIELPHMFADMVADEDKEFDNIRGYFINNGPYGINYTGFKFFIPPGTTNVLFQFSATGINHGGPHIYAAIRFNGEPQASFQEFISREAELACLLTGPFPKMNDLQSPQGFMAKRTSTGERAFLLDYGNVDGVLPEGLKDRGGWVYVNFYNKSTGSNRVPINVIRGMFRVVPEKYNAWHESMNFPSPDPGDQPEPEFGFRIPSRTNAELSQVYMASVNFSNFDKPKSISISGADGRYQIEDGEYTSAQGTVEPGQKVTVELTSSSSYSEKVSTTLNIGGKTGEFSVTTKPDPDGLGQTVSFNDNHVAGVSKNTWVESSVIDVVVNDSIRISPPGQYRINNESYTSQDGTVKPGDRVQVRLRSSDKDYRTVQTSLWIGQEYGVFRVTTAPGSDGGGGGPFGSVDPSGIRKEGFPQDGERPTDPSGPDPDPDPEPVQEKEVWLPSHLKKFNIKEIPSQGRNGPESLEIILELPENWPENGGEGNGYMYGLLDIPGRGQFLAQMDIFENIVLFPYHEGDPLVPFNIEILKGQKDFRLNPFVSLQEWESTAEDLAGLKAGFYIAIISDVNWDDWLGGSFTFTASSGGNINVHALPPAFSSGDNDSGGSDDSLPSGDSLKVEAEHLEFYYHSFPVSGEGLHQPLGLDINLPQGWKELLGQGFEGADPEKIEWSVYAMIVVDDMQDQQFLARSDIHRKPRLVHFNAHTPLRPAAWTKELSSGSDFVDLFPGIDDLELTARDFARLGLDFYVALVPEGNWNNFFGVHFTFQE